MKIFIATALILLIATATAAEVDPTAAIAKNADSNIDAVMRAAQDDGVAELETASHTYHNKYYRPRKCYWRYKRCRRCVRKYVRYCKKYSYGRCVWYGYRKKHHCYSYKCNKYWYCTKYW